jgi:hypothetical protein
VLTIKEILALQPRPKDWDRKSPGEAEITDAIWKERKRRSYTYEDEVFTFLFDQRKDLGIQRIYRLKNQLIDGALELPNGDRVAIEIKLRMNWLTACQSGFQFRHFLAMKGASNKGVKGGIVFFEEFSDGWQTQLKNRPIALGWVAWYREHHRANDLPLQLVRFFRGELETYSEPA